MCHAEWKWYTLSKCCNPNLAHLSLLQVHYLSLTLNRWGKGSFKVLVFSLRLLLPYSAFIRLPNSENCSPSQTFVEGFLARDPGSFINLHQNTLISKKLLTTLLAGFRICLAWFVCLLCFGERKWPWATLFTNPLQDKSIFMSRPCTRSADSVTYFGP